MKRLFYLLHGFILVTCITHSFTMNNPFHTSNPDRLSVRDAQTANDTYDSDQESDVFIDDEGQYEQQEDLHRFSCLFKGCTVATNNQPEIEAHMLNHFKIKCHGCNITSNASHIHKHFQEKRHEKQYPILLTYKSWQNHVQLLIGKGLHFLLASVDSDKLIDSAHYFVNSLKNNLSAEDHALLSTIIPTFDGKSINRNSVHNSPALSSPIVYEEAEECTYQQSPDCIVQSHDSGNNIDEELEGFTDYSNADLFIQDEVQAYEEQQAPQPRQSWSCLFKGCPVTTKSHPEIEAHTLDHFKIKCHGCNTISNARNIHRHFQLKRHAQHPKPRTYRAWQNHVQLLVDKGLHFLLASVDTNKLTDSAQPFVNSLKDNLSAEDHALLSTVIPTFDGKSITNDNSDSLYNSSAVSSPVVYEKQQAPQPGQPWPCLFKSCTATAKSQSEIEEHMLIHIKVKCHGCNITSNARNIHRHYQQEKHTQHTKPHTYQAWQKHVKLLVDKGFKFLLASIDTDRLKDSAHPFVNALKDNLSAKDRALLSTIIPTFDGKSITNDNSDSLYNSPAISSPVVYEKQQAPQPGQPWPCLFKSCTATAKSQSEIEEHMLIHIKIKCHSCNIISDARNIHRHYQLKRHAQHPKPHTYQAWQDHVNLLVGKGFKFLLASVDTDRLKDSARPFVNSLKDNLSAKDRALLSTVIPTFDGKSTAYGNTQSLHNSSAANSLVVYEEAQECTYHPSPDCIVQSHDSNNNTNDAIQSHSSVSIQPKSASTLPQSSLSQSSDKEDESTTKTLLFDKHTVKGIFLCPWKGCPVEKVFNSCSNHLLTHIKMRCFACNRLFCFRLLKSHLLQAHSGDSDFNQKTLKLRDVLTKKKSKLTSIFLVANLMFDHLKPYVQDALIERQVNH